MPKTTNTGQETYGLGYEENIVSKLNQRSIHREAAYLLPYVQKGSQMLDLGCGPGSITLGFAQMIDPGVIIGVDIEPNQIHLANQLAQQNHVENAEFRVGTVYQLPFEDETFDVVFAHTLFMHLSEPETALTELHRVCKKGGVLGLRDGLGSFSHFSKFSIKGVDLNQLLMETTQLAGGSIDIGMRLKGLLHQIGFEILQISPFTEIYDKSADMEMLKNWYQNLLQGKPGRLAVEHGLFTQSALNQMIEDMEDWPNDPAAISVTTWIEHVAQKA